MKNSFQNHKYWFVAAAIIFVLMIVLYPFSVFNTMEMGITRPEAIAIAQKYLLREHFDLNGFSSEAFLDNSPIENRYILKKLGNAGFKEYIKNKKRSTLSWVVMFHQDLPKQIAATTYYVDISNEGEIFGFNREIPDTASIKSLSKPEATALIDTYIKQNLGDEFQGFNLVESKEDSYRNRSDYSFRWEKNETKLPGKLIILAKIQGNRVGSFSYYFEVPQIERGYFTSAEAIYGTVSAIFIIVLILIAFYLFLKKYHQGEIWVNVGRNIFILFFTISMIKIINSWPEIGQGSQLGNLSFTYMKIIILLINGFIIYFFLALLVFASWTVGESYARSLWPEKLKAADAFIKGHFFALNSGTSLMKGFVIGAAISLTVLIGGVVLNTPNSAAFICPTGFQEIFGGWLPALGSIFSGVTVSIISSIVITFFIVNISYQRWKKKWASILLTGLVTLLGFSISATPPSLNNFEINLLSYFIFGCFLAYLYFQFDLMVIGSAMFFYTIIPKGFTLLATNNSFYSWNFAFIILAVVAAPIIYFISRIRKEEFVMENYGLPSHIQRISERERLKKELEIAAKVQLSLLPKEEPKIPGYEISAISIPAVEAGGDYFDFVKLTGDKLGIAIGDVSGKGVGAAIYMTLTKGILQAHAEEDVSPKNVLGKVNRLLYKTIEKNTFVSMFYAILDTHRHTILYARAGHNPGILCSQESGGTKLLLSKGMALGLEEGHIFTSTLNEEEVSLKQGDIFVLYTDGFTEAMNERHEEYSEESLVKLIESNRNLSAHELLNLILKEVKKFVDNYPQHDDMTLVILKRL
ncbi:MAG: PP2C family protein-serine/threonine phosphatase [Ignavibacteriales bacterium]|nr:PP2C family protein-serine/threonine phosphatase [Ignavibacteriales bacterium]